MKVLRIPFSTILLFICAGCIILPVPPYYSKYYGTRGRIQEKTLNFIHVGSTTKEDVLLNLGEPDKAWKEQNRFMYVWALVVTIFAVIVPGPPGSGGIDTMEIPRAYLLLIEFDEKDVVKRFEVKKNLTLKTFSGQAHGGGNISLGEATLEMISEW